jgi:hypothetical protein
MNHSDALKLNAAEKYLLGELSTDQRAAYEDHYFGCPECAEDVRAGATLLDNARHVLRAEFPSWAAVVQPVGGRRGWFLWARPAYALAAMAILAAVLIYQNVVTIPELQRGLIAGVPQALPSFSLVTLGSRAGTSVVITAKPDRPFGLYLDIPASNQFAYYSCRVQTQSGASAFSVQVSAEQARDTVQLLVPGSALKAGGYALVVYGYKEGQGPEATGQEVARYPFVFQTGK